MKRSFSLLTAAFFLSILPGASWAQRDAGVPPMLETQRPLAMPATSHPEPRAPQAEVVKPVAKPIPPATKVAKAKPSQGKKCVAGKASPASQTKAAKATKSAKKKGTTCKPRKKVAANPS
jgi:hypothetical protein